MSEWRNNEAIARQVLDTLPEDLDSRFRIGKDKYGDLFQGDPLDHLYEELLDAIFYCAAAKLKENDVAVWLTEKLSLEELREKYWELKARCRVVGSPSEISAIQWLERAWRSRSDTDLMEASAKMEKFQQSVEFSYSKQAFQEWFHFTSEEKDNG